MTTISSVEKWEYLTPPRKSPDFCLQNATNASELSIKDLHCDRVVLTYLPGVWAPWCRKFIGYLNQNIDFFVTSKFEIRLIAIISQKYEDLFEYVWENDIKFDCLSDPLGAIGKRYCVFDDSIYEPLKISKPSIFILDSSMYIQSIFLGDHLADKPSIEDILLKAEEDYTKVITEDMHVHSNSSFFGGLKKLFY
jgi:peroxiredoxin